MAKTKTVALETKTVKPCEEVSGERGITSLDWFDAKCPFAERYFVSFWFCDSI